MIALAVEDADKVTPTVQCYGCHKLQQIRSWWSEMHVVQYLPYLLRDGWYEFMGHTYCPQCLAKKTAQEAKEWEENKCQKAMSQ